MTDPVLRYPLVNGYVHNWLVLGPFDGSTTYPPFNIEPRTGDDVTTPRELDRVDWQGRGVFWITAACEDDHQLDWSGFLPIAGMRRAWAFAQIESATAQTVTFRASTMGDLRLWHNGTTALDSTKASTKRAQTLVHHHVTVSLQAGINHILACVEQHGVGHLALAMALQLVDGATESLKVCLPTVPHDIELRQRLEESFAQTHLDRAVYTQDQAVNLVLDTEVDTPEAVHLRLQRPSGAIFSETTGKLSTEKPVVGARGIQLPIGEMHAVIMPPLGEFYEGKLRARRACPFWVVRTTDKKRADAAERLTEAVQEAARRREHYADIARVAQGQWDQVRMSTIHEAAQRVHHLSADCLPDAVGLMGLILRLGAASPLPASEVYRIREAIQLCVANAPSVLDLSVESDQLLYLTAWFLGQQHEPSSLAALRLGFPTDAEKKPFEVLAEWLAQRGQHGFGDVRTRVDHLVLALSHLVDLSEETLIRELAAVLLDRLLYDIAIHSIHGVYAPARGAVDGAWLRSGRFTPEAAIGRLLWGMGDYNGDLRSAISLGMASNSYQLPEIIRSIALDRPQSMWVTERRSSEDEAIHVAYKTANFMLASLQDYAPGDPGQREHLWQATLGPEALIFTNHPTTFSQSDSRVAGWWAGNGVRPRVFQWQDALVALYHLPPEDTLGFTHAYFPTYAFDEYTFAEGWAFARAGDGYAALWAARGFELVQQGPDAFRELRSVGEQNAWVCQMGNASFDGDFAHFQERVIAHRPQAEAQRVTWHTIRDDQLHVAWDGPIERNGENVDWHHLPHHQSPYAYADMPANHMDIGIGPDVMRLDFRI